MDNLRDIGVALPVVAHDLPCRNSGLRYLKANKGCITSEQCGHNGQHHATHSPSV
jgi:hypothetical protein